MVEGIEGSRGDWKRDRTKPAEENKQGLVSEATRSQSW